MHVKTELQSRGWTNKTDRDCEQQADKPEAGEEQKKQTRQLEEERIPRPIGDMNPQSTS